MDSFKRFCENIIPVPFVYQSHDYDCGPAALRGVCQFWGVGPDDEEDFVKACKSDTEEGTRPEDLVRTARSFGLKAITKSGLSIDDLKRIIDSGKPVICPIQAWELHNDEYGEDDYSDNDSGHYVVAIGYDQNNIIFQDPSIKNNRRGSIPYGEFERRWHDVDRQGSILTRFGIILWRDDVPEDVDFDTRSSHIK